MRLVNDILPLREQATIRDRGLKIRLESLIPELLQRENIDMWIISCREYNEDPVLMSMLPATSMSARRRTMLIFARQKNGEIERLTLSRYGYDDLYDPVWDPDEEDQFACLSRIVKERDPQTIGINSSNVFSFADGITRNEYELVSGALGDEFSSRLVNAEGLCVGWLERRIPEEIHVYPQLVEMGHEIIERAFSTDVIQPGSTTTDDVVWWMRQTMRDAGLDAWFHPTIDIQARDQSYEVSDDPRKTIERGDLLHCDMGFHYLGLATDQQQHAYVLDSGESDALAGLRDALLDGNRMQDIHLEEMQVGRSGNDVLHLALARAQEEGIRAQIYTHPLGYHGHAAGPIIGLWDRQEGVPGVGDYPLFDDTVYSIELNIVKSVPEWNGQDVRIMLEEDALLADGTMRWLDGRQESLYLIG